MKNKMRQIFALGLIMVVVLAFATPVLAMSPSIKDLNITAPSTFSLAAGQSETLSVSFSGMGIDWIDVEMSGEGLTAKITDSSWNAYPNTCTASISVTATNDCKGGTLTFVLKNNNLGTIHSKSIKIEISNSNVATTVNKPPKVVKNLSSGIYTFESLLVPGKVLDVAEAAHHNEAQVHIWDYVEGENQKWYVFNVGNGYYKIIAAHSDKVLDVSGGSDKSEVKVQQYSDNGTDAQLWKICQDGNGYYILYPKCGNNTVLDVQGAGNKNGTKVWAYTFNDTNAQKWRLNRINIFSSSSSQPVSKTIEIYSKFTKMDLKKVSDDAIEEVFSSFVPRVIQFGLDIKSILGIGSSFLSEEDRTITIPQSVVQKAINKKSFISSKSYAINLIEWSDEWTKNKRTVYKMKLYETYSDKYYCLVQVIEQEMSWGEWKDKQNYFYYDIGNASLTKR